MELTVDKASPSRMGRVWLALGLPPLLFLAVIVLGSVVVGVATQSDADAIAAQMAGATPYLLLVGQVLMLGLVIWTLRAEGLSWRALGWHTDTNQPMWREAALGALVGVPLGVAYIFVLSPLMGWLQRTIGDYVPPEQLLTSLGAAAIPFFIANVLLAPFVEETLYRGYGITRLRERYSLPAAIVISCLWFGALHWAGGVWYIVLTGAVAGGVLAGLFAWRKTIVAAYAAHLALNLTEFVLVTALVG